MNNLQLKQGSKSFREKISSLRNHIEIPGRMSDVLSSDFKNFKGIEGLKDKSIVLDPAIPSLIPQEKASFCMKWDWKHQGTENTFDLGNISLTDMFKNSRWREGVLNHSEIHLVWNPHLPVNTYLETTVAISMEFTATNEESEKEMQKVIFPAPLHTHIIFCPGHSTKLGLNSKLPWSIRVNLDNNGITRDYKVADIYVRLVGYNSLVSTYTSKRGVELISMVPMEENYQGITLNRPRIIGSEWKIGKHKMGIKSQSDLKILMKLGQYGINIEGMQMSGKLGHLIKRVKKMTLNDSEECKIKVLEEAYKSLV